MEKAYKIYLTLVLTEGFNTMTYKNVSVFTVTYSHETSKHLLWELFLQYSIKEIVPDPQFPADLVTFTEAIFNGKLFLKNFLCSVNVPFLVFCYMLREALCSNRPDNI